jgi:hypothetical protein
MLDNGGDDNVIRSEIEAVGEVVDGFGGVAAQDGDVVPIGSAGELKSGRSGILVGGGGRWDFQPAPRCTLEYHGTNSWTRSRTAGRAEDEAPVSNERYLRSTPST